MSITLQLSYQDELLEPSVELSDSRLVPNVGDSVVIDRLRAYLVTDRTFYYEKGDTRIVLGVSFSEEHFVTADDLHMV